MVDPVGGGHRVRDAALRILTRVDRGRRSDRSLDAVLGRHRMDARDRGLCTEIVYGTLRRRTTLDRTLAPFCRRPLESLDTPVRAALRMAAYQCAFLDSVPPHAAVHRTVEALKRQRPRATGLANAVLRAWLRAGGELDGGAGSLAERLELPEWLAARWAKRPEAEPWLEAALRPPRGFLRLSAGADQGEVIERLRSAGGNAQPGTRVARSVAFDGVDRDTLFGVMDAGLALPRSEAAQLATGLLSTGRGPVLDACSGRGGKARQLAEAGQPVVCVDSHAGRLRDSYRLAGTTGATGLAWVRADLAQSPPLRSRFSRILVDVPCSGLGTMRRHPEIKWNITPARLADLASAQRAILGRCLELLEPGGELLYVTCSTEPEENEQVVESVLRQANGVARQPFATAPEGCSVDELGDLRTYPTDPDLDGFYVARLTRLGDSAP